jgi:uncharacterized membrane protein
VDWYHIVLRAVHILAGIFWAGSAMFFFFLLEPSVKELGETGQKVMGHLAVKKKMPVIITAAAGLTVLAGVLLYWRDSNGFDLDWITSGPGLGFTVGGVAATLAFAFGLIFIKPSVDRMSAIGQAVAAAGEAPTESQTAELHRLDAKLALIGRLDAVLIGIAMVTMATARFL